MDQRAKWAAMGVFGLGIGVAAWAIGLFFSDGSDAKNERQKIAAKKSAPKKVSPAEKKSLTAKNKIDTEPIVREARVDPPLETVIDGDDLPPAQNEPTEE